MKDPNDNDNYKVTIKNIWLYVPVGIMTEKLTEEMFARWAREPMKYYYDRYTVKSFTIPPKQSQWSTDNIFPESICPTRVFVMLVDSEAFLGDQKKNPFCFRRKWVVEETSGLEAVNNVIDLDSSYLKTKMDEMSQAMALLVEQNRRFAEFMKNDRDETGESTPDTDDEESDNESLARKKTRKRPRKDANTQPKNTRSTRSKKKSKDAPATPQPPAPEDIMSTSRSLFNFWSKPSTSAAAIAADQHSRRSTSVESFVVLDRPGTSQQQQQPGEPQQQPPQVLNLNTLNADPTPAKVKVTYFVTRMELDLLNAPIDQLFQEATVDNVMPDYVR